jgi:uncharacterized coiled-coil protein SlyX
MFRKYKQETPMTTTVNDLCPRLDRIEMQLNHLQSVLDEIKSSLESNQKANQKLSEHIDFVHSKYLEIYPVLNYCNQKLKAVQNCYWSITGTKEQPMATAIATSASTKENKNKI